MLGGTGGLNCYVHFGLGDAPASVTCAPAAIDDLRLLFRSPSNVDMTLLLRNELTAGVDWGPFTCFVHRVEDSAT